MKRTASIIAALLLCVAAMAQGFSGGIKASVVNRQGRAPIAGATVELYQGGELIATKVADAEGRFLFENVPNGSYSISVSADGFMDSQINVIVEKGLMRDLMFVTLSPGSMLTDDVDASNFSEFDMDDSGYTDNPTILFTSNDPYNKIVSFGFSAIRFKNRGYNSETQDVFLSGVNLNDAITGYSPYSLWTGLNEVMRAKDTSNGLDVSDYGIGGYNGTTNIFANPSNVRPGLRASILSNSALYRLRLMLTYASGTKDNGWSYAFSASARLGGNDWVKGVYYRSFAYYAGAEKKINDLIADFDELAKAYNEEYASTSTIRSTAAVFRGNSVASTAFIKTAVMSEAPLCALALIVIFLIGLIGEMKKSGRKSKKIRAAAGTEEA